VKSIKIGFKVSVREDAPPKVLAGVVHELQPIMEAFAAEVNPGFEGLIETEIFVENVPDEAPKGPEVASPWIPKSELVENRVYPVKGANLLLAIWRNNQFVGRRYDEELGRYVLGVETHFEDGGTIQAYHTTALTKDYTVAPDTPPGTILHELEEIEQETGVRVF
jgi:hypothetical protein